VHLLQLGLTITLSNYQTTKLSKWAIGLAYGDCLGADLDTIVVVCGDSIEIDHV
jgi:hypothetical protein